MKVIETGTSVSSICYHISNDSIRLFRLTVGGNGKTIGDNV